MRILVACELPVPALDQLHSLASDVVYRPDATAQDLRESLADVGILIVGSTRVSAEAVAHAKTLQMIVHAGPGPGDLALEEASAQGIFVAHCPDQPATAVAELTFGLILALDRRIVENTLALREGSWKRDEVMDARGLAGRTIGILGYGAVGRLVAQRALAFEMRVVAWSPTLAPTTASQLGIEFCNWPRELARQSDIVTVHTGAEGERETLIDAEFLQSMQPGAYLIHVGHPGAVDEAALAEAITQRSLRVGIDVFASAPTGDHARFRSRLCEMPGVVATQQVGPLTEQARQAAAAEVVRIVRSYLVSGEVLDCLNLCERSPATWELVVRVRDQVGVMAAILAAVRADGVNAEEITSRVFTGAKAACCTVALDERPSTEALEAVRALPGVLHLELRAVV